MNAITRGRLQFRTTWRRWQIAWAYAVGRLDRLPGHQLWDLLYDVQNAAGIWPLETIDAEGVAQMAKERWQERPEFDQLAAEAAARVASKWSSDGHLSDAAEEWALGLFQEYAKQQGVELVERECDAERVANEEKRAVALGLEPLK